MQWKAAAHRSWPSPLLTESKLNCVQGKHIPARDRFAACRDLGINTMTLKLKGLVT